MVDWLSAIIQRLLRIPTARTRRILHIGGVILAATTFVLTSTLLVAFDSIFLGANNIAALRIGDTVRQDIRAPISLSYISQVLTEQRRQDVRNSVAEIYFPPDPAISRQQSDLARQILDYITNIRRDPFGSPEQKLDDLSQIADLTLDETVTAQLLGMDEQTWSEVTDQITGVLERVMRGEIREDNLQATRDQLPMQVSVRFTEDQVNGIVAVVEDLIRPNTLLNQEATESARENASASIEVRRSFERGQIVVRTSERIDEAAYEALGALGLLEPAGRQVQVIGRAFLASIIVLVIAGLYIARFKPSLFQSSRFLALIAGLFLIVLAGARISGDYGQIYLYPTAALALLYVALVGAETAVIGMLGLSVLVGLMQNNSLEIMVLIGAGGMMAALTLRRAERLNGYFKPGLLVGLTNTAVIAIFYQGSSGSNAETALVELLIYNFLNGVLAAAVALGGMYIVTLLFNLPTALKLAELSQPSQPLLQRLLREAPGTYQHSLQVANLGEQAANGIGANADLVRVAALYHDIGKMLNAPFFTENQAEGVNPHDVLNDPARSADIIISHVTDGEKIARQYRLPARLRDFILEHHGTQVLYFYQQAVERAGDDEVVDKEQFTYPGPRPQSRETAVLMLADSCEAAVRSRKPAKKQDIMDTVQQIFDTKIRTGQLDESGLTLNDINVIRQTLIDMLQAVFHPRISYPIPAPSASKRDTGTETPHTTVRVEPTPDPNKTATVEDVLVSAPSNPVEPARPALQTKEIPTIRVLINDSDDTPLPDVPPLPRTGDNKTIKPDNGGMEGANTKVDISEEG